MLFKITLITLILYLPASNCDGEEKFEAYLEQIMSNYSVWLQDNGLDPTLPVPRVLPIKSDQSATVQLECELRNQQLRGHSVSHVYEVYAQASFVTHSFNIYRRMNETMELFGDFSCTGKLTYDYLNRSDVSFTGSGQFEIKAGLPFESYEIARYGITEDYKLDFANVFYHYVLVWFAETKTLIGNWNVDLDPSQMANIEDEFNNMYRSFMGSGFFEEEQHFLKPAYYIIKEYMDNKTKDFDLRTIMDEDDLPEPYPPKATSTTTVTPTTVVTETTLSQSSTSPAEGTTTTGKISTREGSIATSETFTTIEVPSMSEASTTTEISTTTDASPVTELSSALETESTTQKSFAKRLQSSVFTIVLAFAVCII